VGARPLSSSWRKGNSGAHVANTRKKRRKEYLPRSQSPAPSVLLCKILESTRFRRARRGKKVFTRRETTKYLLTESLAHPGRKCLCRPAGLPAIGLIWGTLVVFVGRKNLARYTTHQLNTHTHVIGFFRA